MHHFPHRPPPDAGRRRGRDGRLASNGGRGGGRDDLAPTRCRRRIRRRRRRGGVAAGGPYGCWSARSPRPCSAPWSTGCSSGSGFPPGADCAVVQEAARRTDSAGATGWYRMCPPLSARAAPLSPALASVPGWRRSYPPRSGTKCRSRRPTAEDGARDNRLHGPDRPHQVTVLEFKTGRPRAWHERSSSCTGGPSSAAPRTPGSSRAGGHGPRAGLSALPPWVCAQNLPKGDVPVRIFR